MTDSMPSQPARPNRRVLLAGASAAAASLGRPASAQPAPRIVAAGGVITEIVYALGRQDLIVGVDTTSLFPAEALRDKANVGYVRALSTEGVLSLRPTHMLAVEGAGPPDAVKLIAEAGVRVERVSEDNSEKGVAERIRAIGRFVGAEPEANQIAASVEAGFAELKLEREGLAARKRVLFVLSLQNGRVLVGGRGTSADAVIGLAGAVNAADMVEGFKPLTDEGIISAAPDVVLMMQHTSQENPTDRVFAHSGFASTPAAKTRALVVMDGLYLLGFGPRTPRAAHDLMAAIYGTAGRGNRP